MAAEEYELVAEQELLARSLRENTLDSETILYLDARSKWRAVVFAAPAIFSEEELTQARTNYQYACDAWRPLVRFAGDISEAELSEVELLHFQTKEYRLALAKLHSDPTDYELTQARVYYELALEEWKAIRQQTSIQLDLLSKKGYWPGDPPYDDVARIRLHGQKRAEAIDRITGYINSAVNNFPAEEESGPHTQEEQSDAQTDLRSS
jgi:hypothetical protein